MTDDGLLDLIDPVLRAGGSAAEPGEDYRRPPIEILRYYRRGLRWNALPILGRALSVVAIVRGAVDEGPPGSGFRQLLERTAMVVGTRFSPWTAPTIGLTVVSLTDRSIGLGDESALDQALDSSMRRFRVVPLGLILANLREESLGFALRSGPDRLFPEPVLVADTLGDRLRRFVDHIPT
jgi:hypothetical protein